MARNTKPFAVKGMSITSPKGSALWCKVKEPDYKFNAKGILSTDLVCDPEDKAVQNFIAKLEEIRDTALLEARETLGAKGKGLKAREIYKDEYDQDGEPTGNIVFKFALKDVDDKEPPKNKIKVFDAKVKEIKDVPLVGNGSIIKCNAYANPYYMATTKEIGISLLWQQMQILELNEYGGASAFDEEDGFEADEDYTPSSNFDGDDEDDF